MFKKTAIILSSLVLVVLNINLLAQKNTPFEFWEIPFGLSQNKVKELMIQKDGVRYQAGNTAALMFSADLFEGKNCDYISCWFDEDKFSMAIVHFTPDIGVSLFDLYYQLKEILTTEHGKPNSSENNITTWITKKKCF